MTADSPKRSKRRYWKWLLGLVVVGLGGCLAITAGYAVLELRPHYITLSSRHWAWNYVKKSTVIEHEVGNAYEKDNKIWMWQGTGLFSLGPDDTPDSVFQEFEALLGEDTWEAIPRGDRELDCDRFLEIRLPVDETRQKLAVYRSRKDSHVTACLFLHAISPYYVYVTLTTANPSFMTRIPACPFGC